MKERRLATAECRYARHMHDGTPAVENRVCDAGHRRSYCMSRGGRATFSSYYLSRGARVAADSKKTELLQGTLDLIVLKLLRAGPANGWELTRTIQAVSRGTLDVNYGSLYPALRRLEASGFVSAEWSASENNRRARYYTLTAAGRKQLAVEQEAWERFSEALELILRMS